MNVEIDSSLRGQLVVVTGAAGFIGRSLCAALVARGARVLGVDLQAWDAFPGERWIQDDVLALTPDSLGEERPDVVFHLPALVGVSSAASDPERTRRAIVAPLAHFLKISEDNPPRAFVFVSSSEVYGEGSGQVLLEHGEPAPLSSYGKAKVEGEKAVEAWSIQSGGSSAIVRPFNVYGPGQRPDFVVSAFARNALTNDPLVVVGDGAQTRTFTYIDDFVRGLIASAQTASPEAPVFNIAGGETFTIEALATKVISIAGSDSRIVYMDGPDIGRPSEIEIHSRRPSVAKAHAEFGFVSAVSLEDGLERVVEYERRKVQPTAAPKGGAGL